MRQQAQGESDYLVAQDRYTRKRGWDAYHAGVPMSQNPEPDHPNSQYSQKLQWEYGWTTAQRGEIPW